MWKTLSFVLPVLMPSWRFFKTIEPSPRVEFAIIGEDGKIEGWCDAFPRPATLSPCQITRRLFWNPAWNDALFMVSCAERIAEQPTYYSINEIRQRIRQLPQVQGAAHGRFRLTFVSRVGADVSRDVVFIADAFLIRG
jgi:hypothetical protein